MRAWSWFTGLLLAACAVNVAGSFLDGLAMALCGLVSLVLSMMAVVMLIALEDKKGPA